MRLGGKFEIVLYASEEGRERVQRTVLRVLSRDSRTEPDRDVLVDALGELFDPESEGESKQADLFAERAFFRRQQSDNERAPAYENRVDLEGLEATFLRDIFLAPLSFEAPQATLNALEEADRRLVSERPFTLSSPALDGGGIGIVMHLDNDLLEVNEKGWIVFHRLPDEKDRSEEEAFSARFSSEETGALQIRSLPGSDRSVFVAQAWQGTRLDIGGERPALLTARETTLRASSRGADGTMTLDDLEAADEVHIDLDGNRLQARRASVEFDDDGAPLRASLSGLPRAVFPLEVGELSEAFEEADSLTVDVTGTETLEVRWDEGYHVTLVGPTTLVATGMTVRAARGLTGFRSAEGRSARFVATGGVILETDRGTLETADLVIELEPDAAGRMRFTGRASDGARIAGTLEDGRAFTTTTPDAMTIVGTRDEWLVREGNQIEVTVDGPEGFYARADRVEQVDLQNLSLQAFGNVNYRSDAPGRSYQLNANQLRIASEQVQTGPDTAELRYVVEAIDEVEGTLGAAGRTTSVRCQHLSVVHTEFRGSLPLQMHSRVEATGQVDAAVFLRGEQVNLKAEDMRVERKLSGDDTLEESLFADTDVEFEGERGFPFKGSGDRLVMNADGTARLVSHEGRITLLAKLQGGQLPFDMTADEVTFDEMLVRAKEPSVGIGSYRIRASRMVRSADAIELTGDVHASGFTPREVPFSLYTQRLRLEGRAELSSSGEVTASQGDLRVIHATEGVRFHLENLLRAEGESFEWKKIHGTMRVEGKPVRAFSSVAQTYMETDWIEFDPALQMIIGTGPGKVLPIEESAAQESGAVPSDESVSGVRRVAHRPAQEEEPLSEVQTQSGTTIDFLSTATQVDTGQDSLVFLIQEPVFRSPETSTTLRASWAVFWIDRERWLELQDAERSGNAGIVENLRRSFDSLGAEARAKGPLSKLVDRFHSGPLSGLLREMYFEGPVEYIESGDLIFRSDAVYLDALEGRGWLAGATVNIYGRLIGEDFEKLIVKTDWLRHSTDGALRADDATVTSCTFDDPHLKVVTGDLRIYPLALDEGVEQAQADGTLPRNRAPFRLLMKNNRIEAFDLLRIPLPTIDLKTDEKFRPLWRTLSLGNSARFGTLLSLGASIPAGRAGEAVNELVSGDKEEPFDASFEIEGSYLGSRGGLLDLGIESKSARNYEFELYTGIIYDRGEDRGFIRVPKDERSTFRYWLRSYGTFERGDSTLGFSLSHQSDEGVQSEFYEREFLRYERAETYVQWRRSKNEWFTQITVKPRVDDFRTQIEELPSASALRSRAPLFRIGKQPIQWVGDGSVDYLRRLEADIDGPDLTPTGDENTLDPLTSPFGLPSRYPDQLGEREVLRVDTTQALEAPMPLNVAGLRLTPFVRARGTIWSEGVEPDESPTRGYAEAGARLASTFWRKNPDGTTHQLVPYLGVRSQLVRQDEYTPVTFGPVEEALTGDIVEAGTRGRLGLIRGRSFLDFDVRAHYAADRSDGKSDGWLPFGTFTRVNISPFGRPFELWYDARYDFEDNQTDYSLVSIGTRFGERFGLQAGHQRGRDRDGRSLFEAATVEGIFRWTEKWEFEARQAFSLLDDQELDLRVAVRRFGHDVVFDIEAAVREGEGTSFGISLRPRFGYRRPRIGYVPW